PMQRYTQGGLDFLAYRVESESVAPGGALDLALYWRAVRPPAENLHVTVTLTDLAGERVALSYRRHVGGYPTTRWLGSRYVRDQHRLEIPADLPPGQYLVQVALWDCPASTLGACQLEQRVEFYDERGTLLGQSLTLPIFVQIAP
ncbi:MAG: hypothetical protein JW910_12440, partial [Anaerolineae bacterium]|nr:hypothetical protein [Anaerolineae bacterium]